MDGNIFFNKKNLRFSTKSQSSTSSPIKISNERENNWRTMSVNRGESSVSDITMNLMLLKPETITRIATQLFMFQVGFTSNDVAKFLLKK